MKGTRSIILFVGIVVITVLSHCKKAELFVPFDSSGQYEIDSTALGDYLATSGIDYSLLDTLTNKVLVDNDTVDRIRTIYAILDQGAGETLELNDIVSYNFNIRTTDDSVRVTNISSVAIAYDLYDSSFVDIYSPLKFTLASSGWTVGALFGSLTSSLSILDGPYVTALATVTAKMNVGGHAVIFFLSPIYYSSQFPGTTIYYVEIFPVQVRKPNS
ncbi:MAG: hypothetical protein ACJA08_003375 [Cyclobacteriaceae bacterium]|jgi:hypothetical protein